MLCGLLIRSASDPYSGPTLGKGGGGGFRLKPHIEAVSSECGEMGDV